MLPGPGHLPADEAVAAGKAFMQRCRAYISDQYIPGMSAAGFFDPYMSGPAAAPPTPLPPESATGRPCRQQPGAAARTDRVSFRPSPSPPMPA